MGALNEIPRLPDVGLRGSFGVSTQELLTLQRNLASQQGPLVRGRILHLPVIFPCTPEAAHEVLVTKAKSFEKSPGLRVLLHPLAGQGLFTSEGHLWRQQRKLMAPIFQPAPMHQYAETMRQIAERAADRMRDDASIDLAHETTRIAMSVVGKALFDADTFDEADELGAALTTCLRWANAHLASSALVAHVLMLDATKALARRTSGAPRSWFEKKHEQANHPFLLAGTRDANVQAAVKLLDDRIQAMIDERRRHGLARKDLLTRLLAARDDDAGGARMTDKQVRDEAITLFVAGHETTATALAWSFYLLARHPEILAGVQAEADAFGGAEITNWDSSKLALTTRVFKEALRLYPPLMLFARRSLEPLQLCGYDLPAKTLTFVSAYAQHYRKDVFVDPHTFNPDRWLPEAEATRPKGSYLPFGAGPRVCIGLHFALMEGPIVLATLLRRWRFEIDKTRTVTEDNFATLRPKGGVSAIVMKRG